MCGTVPARGIARSSRHGARTPRHRGTERLDRIDKNVPERLDIQLVLGNASAHNVLNVQLRGRWHPASSCAWTRAPAAGTRFTPHVRTNTAIRIPSSFERYLGRLNAPGR